MNKDNVIKQTIKSTALPEAIVEAVLNNAFEIMSDALHRKEDVSIPGVGHIKFVEAKAKVARNPMTNEPYYLGNDLRLKFKPTIELKNHLVRTRITKKEYETAKAAEQK